MNEISRELKLGFNLCDRVTVEVKSGTFMAGFGNREHDIVAYNWDYSVPRIKIDQHLIRSFKINIDRLTFRQVSMLTGK